MTRFDRSHFNEYGDFSLNYETVFYVNTPDYNTWMDVQQAINLGIHEEFEKEAIEFAYPTQTLFMATPALPDKPASCGSTDLMTGGADRSRILRA